MNRRIIALILVFVLLIGTIPGGTTFASLETVKVALTDYSSRMNDIETEVADWSDVLVGNNIGQVPADISPTPYDLMMSGSYYAHQEGVAEDVLQAAYDGLVLEMYNYVGHFDYNATTAGAITVAIESGQSDGYLNPDGSPTEKLVSEYTASQSVLSDLMSDVQTFLNTATAGNIPGTYPQSSLDGLQTAITATQERLNNDTSIDLGDTLYEAQKLDIVYQATLDAMLPYHAALSIKVTVDGVEVDLTRDEFTYVDIEYKTATSGPFTEGGVEGDYYNHFEYGLDDPSQFDGSDAKLNMVFEHNGEAYIISTDETLTMGDNVLTYISDDFYDVTYNADAPSNGGFAAMYDMDRKPLEYSGALSTINLEKQAGPLSGYGVSIESVDGTESMYLYHKDAYSPVDNDVITVDQNLQVIWLNDPVVFGAEVNAGELFRIEDSYGHEFACTEHRESGNTFTEDIVFEVLDDNGSVVQSHMILSELHNTYHHQWLDLGGLNGIYDVRITMPQVGPDALSILITDIEFDDSHQGGYDVDWKLRNFTYDDINKHFVFDILEDATLEGINFMHLHVGGLYLDGFMPQSAGADIFKGYNMKLYDETAGQYLDGVTVRGRYWNSESPHDGKLNFEVFSEDEGMYTDIGLVAGHTYRLEPVMDEARDALDFLMSNIYVPDGEKSNLYIEVRHETFNNTDSTLRYYGEGRYQVEGLSADSPATGYVLDAERDFYYAGNNIELPINQTYGSSIDKLVVKLETGNTDLSLIDMSNTSFALYDGESKLADGVYHQVLGSESTEAFYEFDMSAVGNVSTWTIKGDGTEILRRSFEKFDHQDWNARGISLLAYDGSGNLIGLHGFEGSRHKVIVDPALRIEIDSESNQIIDPNEAEIIYDGDVTRIIGRMYHNAEHFNDVNFRIKATDTGIVNADRIAVEVTVEAEGEAPMHTYVTMYHNGPDTYFGTDFRIRSVEFDDYIKWPPASFDPLSYQTNGDGEHYNDVPVYSSKMNTITFTLDNGLGDTVTKVIEYYPNSSRDFFDGDWIDIVNDGVGPDLHKLRLNMPAFIGDESNLSVNFHTIDTIESGEPGADGLGAFESVIDRVDWTEFHEDTLTGEIFEEQRMTLTLGPDQDDVLDFIGVSEEEEIFAEVVYHDSFQSTDGTFVHDVDFGFKGDHGRSYYSGSPDIHDVRFYRLDDAAGSILYGYEVGMNPGVFMDDVDVNMFAVYDWKTDLDTGIRPVKFEMHPQDSGEYRRVSDATNRFIMYFDQDVSDYDIRIENVLTSSGQRLLDPEYRNLEIRSRVEGYLRRADYSAFADSGISMISLESIAGINDLMEMFMQNPASIATLEKIGDMEREWMMTSSDGFFKEYLTAGDFRVLGYSELMDDTAWSHDYGLHVDDVHVPILNDWESLEVTLQVHPANMTASMPRVNGYEAVDEFVIMTADAFTVQTELDAYIHSTDFNDLDDNIKDKYYELDHLISKVYGFRVKTDLAGHMETYLNPGQYVIAQRVYGGTHYDVETPIKFTVDATGVTDLGVLPFEAPNTFIQFLDSDGVPVTNARVNIGGPSHVFGMTDDLGLLAIHVDAEGVYKLEYVETTWETEGSGLLYDMNGSDSGMFDIVSGTNEYIIQLPAPEQVARTVKGTVPVALDDAYLQTTQGGVHSSTGVWKFYGCEGVEISSIGYNGQDIDFVSPVMLTSDTVLDIQNYINFEVQIVSPSGDPLPDRLIGIDIHGINGYEGVSADNGSAYFMIDTDEMEPGHGYEVSAQWLMYNGEHADINLRFEDAYDVDGDGDTTEGLMITPEMLQNGTVMTKLVIVPPNFSGKITNEGLYKDGWINIERMDGEGDKNWLHSHIDRLTGEFSFSINEPGRYIVRSAGHRDEYSDINFAFIAEADGNNIIIKDVNGQVLTMPLTLQLGDANANFKGQLFKMGTTPFGDPNVVGHIDMKIIKKDVSEMIFQKWVQVDPNGEFSCFLDPFGDQQYIITEISTYYHNYRFEAGLPITLDESSNQVIVPAFNFTGTATDYDGNKPFQGDVNIEIIEMIDGVEVIRYDHVRIDPVGDFVDMMEEGLKLVVRDLWYQFDGQEFGQHFRFQMPVTVGENSTGILLTPNLKGTIDYGSLLTGEPKHMGISFRPELDRNDFETDEAYNAYMNEPWCYDYWTEVSYDKNEGVGTFYMYLPDGDYIISGMDLDGQYMDMNYAVTLASDGSIHNATVVDGKYAMALSLSNIFNVTGVLKDEAGQLITDAWVSVEKVDESWSHSHNNEWFGSCTDDTGAFRLVLDEGHYVLNSYHTQGYWEDGLWRDGDHVEIKRKFMINASGDLLDENGINLANLNVQPNVTGSVQGYRGGLYFDVTDAWFRIAPVKDGVVDYEASIHGNTGWEDNTFSMMLAPGDYRVLEAGGRDTWFELNQDFSVIDGQTTQLTIKPAQPNFEGIAAFDEAGTNLLQWGYIAIKPENTPEHDWSNVIHIETDGEGQFARRIPQGNWTIVHMGNHSSWERLDIDFSVDANGNVSSTELVSKGAEFLVAPPAANFTGQIYDEQSLQVDDHAWMIVKPATAGAHDWSEAEWIEMKYRNGKWSYAVHLDAGDYRVVEAGGPGFWYMTNQVFTITNGQVTEMNVQPQQPNFTATVYSGETTDSDVMSDSWVMFMRVDELGNQLNYLTGEALNRGDEIDWSQTYGTHVDNQGNFKLILDENAEYQMISVGGGDDYYETSQIFTVTDSGMDVTRPVMPTIVTLTDIPEHMLDTDLVDTAWLIGRTGTTGNYEYFELEGIETDINSQSFDFKGEWKDGEYQLVYLFSENGELLMDRTETISGGVMGTLSVEDTSKSDVTVTFQVDGIAVTDAISVTLEVTLPDGTTKSKIIKTDTTGTATIAITKKAYWMVVEMGTKDGYFQLDGQTSIHVLDQDEETIGTPYNITRP